MNGDVQSDLSTLAFKNGKQLEDFHSKILRLQQEILISWENFSPTRLLFQYMKAFSKSVKPRYLIAPKMTDLIPFLDNNRKYFVYTGGDITWTYSYLEMIGAPTSFTYSGQSSNYFSPPYSINNYTSSLQTVIASLRTIHKSICEWCGRIGHKFDACIICGPKLLPQSHRIKMNQFNSLHGDELNEPPREWSIQPTAAHFQSRTSPSNTSPVVSAIMGRLNHHLIHNVDAKVHTSDFKDAFNSESVPDPYTTPIRSIDDDET